MGADNKETVKFKGCFICLRTDHSTSNCPQKDRCQCKFAQRDWKPPSRAHHSRLHVLKSQSVQQSAYPCSAQSSEDLSGEDLKELEAADDILEYSSTDDGAEVNEVVNLIARGQKLAEEAKRKGNDIAPPSGSRRTGLG